MYAAQQLLGGMATILDSKQDTTWQHTYMTQLAVMSNIDSTQQQATTALFPGSVWYVEHHSNVMAS